jgi:alpha-glucosidase
MEVLRADTSSILHLYRRLLVARRGSSALRSGSWEPRPAPEGVLAYERNAPDRADSRTILVNFTEQTRPVPVRLTDPTVEVASDAVGEGLPYHGTLAPDQALILR